MQFLNPETKIVFRRLSGKKTNDSKGLLVSFNHRSEEMCYTKQEQKSSLWFVIQQKKLPTAKYLCICRAKFHTAHNESFPISLVKNLQTAFAIDSKIIIKPDLFLS